MIRSLVKQFLFTKEKEKISKGNCNNNLLANKVEFLKKVSIFADWPFSKIIAFLQLLQEKKLNKNDLVFKEDDSADFIYFIKEGEIEVLFQKFHFFKRQKFY